MGPYSDRISFERAPSPWQLAKLPFPLLSVFHASKRPLRTTLEFLCAEKRGRVITIPISWLAWDYCDYLLLTMSSPSFDVSRLNCSSSSFVFESICATRRDDVSLSRSLDHFWKAPHAQLAASVTHRTTGIRHVRLFLSAK